MKINFKINIETQAPDSEINEMLKETGKKMSDYRKILEYELEKEISNIFIQDEIISCKVKATFKKDKEGENTDK